MKSIRTWFLISLSHLWLNTMPIVICVPQSEIKWVPEHCELRIFLRLWMTISEKCFIFQDFLLNKPQLFFGFVCCPKVSMILNSYVKSYDQKIGVKKSWVRSAQVFLLLNREFHSVSQWYIVLLIMIRITTVSITRVAKVIEPGR